MKQINLKENYFLYAFMVFFSLLLISPSIFAQAAPDDDEDYNKGVSVSPSRMEFNVETGKTSSKNIKVTNFTGKSQKFRVVYNDFDMTIDGNSSFLEAGTSIYSLSEFVSISPTFVEIDPGSFADISITVSVPATPKGEKAAWGVVLIEQAEEKKVLDPGNSSGNTVAFGITPTFAFGVWLYQNPPNVENMLVDITNFMHEKKNTSNMLFLDVENKGDGISFCHAYVELTNLSTGKQQILGGKKYTILPRYKRSFIFELPDQMDKGNYSAIGVLDYNSDEELVAAELDFMID